MLILVSPSLAAVSDRETVLMLRRPDERRKTTQRWEFTQDGRLCCAATQTMCVQVRPVFGLNEGEYVVGLLREEMLTFIL